MKPHQGILILILGIASLVILPLPLGPMAWVQGTQDLKEMAAGRMDPDGGGMTHAGRVCGMIATIISATVVVAVLLYVYGLHRGW
jgi:hypothetical protein